MVPAPMSLAEGLAALEIARSDQHSETLRRQFLRDLKSDSLICPGYPHFGRSHRAICTIWYMGTMKLRLNSRLLAFACYQHLQDRFEGDLSFSRAGAAVLELDPAVVEAIQHPNSGCGTLHALRLE